MGKIRRYTVRRSGQRELWGFPLSPEPPPIIQVHTGAAGSITLYLPRTNQVWEHTTWTCDGRSPVQLRNALSPQAPFRVQRSLKSPAGLVVEVRTSLGPSVRRRIRRGNNLQAQGYCAWPGEPSKIKIVREETD